MHVLFIGPKTYNYHQTLVYYLRQSGADVTFIGEDNLDVRFRMARFFGGSALNKYITGWWNKVEAIVDRYQFDKVLVIRGEMLLPWMLELMRSKLPDVEFIMYQWDSVSNHQYLPLVQFFDDVTTFDRKDADEYGFNYLPLFYDLECEQIRNNMTQQTIDILMVGSLHNDRLPIAKQIRSQAREAGLNAYFFLYSPLMTFAKKSFVGGSVGYDREMVKFKSMPKNEYLGLLARSKVVLDINAPQQNGLTIRTMETLGAGRKVMTCNDFICRDKFYLPEWISIFDRAKPQLDYSFFSTCSGAPQVDDFRIDRWLVTLLEKQR